MNKIDFLKKISFKYFDLNLFNGKRTNNDYRVSIGTSYG